jgi:nitrogen fixation-related uncharacterized protein
LGAAGILSGYFYSPPAPLLIHTPSGYNLPMSSSKLIIVGVALLIGIAGGLAYGWAVNPIQYTDITPNILREDYRVDYILTIAEAYQSDFDADAAARRLAALGSESPAALVTSALDYARRNNFTETEIQTLQSLLTAMQTHQPQGMDAP